MVYEDEAAQYKMYLMDEVQKLTRQARIQGMYIGVILSAIVNIALFWLGRVIG